MISVITPTWQRHKTVCEAINCVFSQQIDVPAEHIIVSDGPDPELRKLINSWWLTANVRYFELPEHDPEKHWGAPARLKGLSHAHGDFIAYLDDDDLWEPNHLATMLAVFDDPEVQWARSCGIIPSKTPWRIGDGPLIHGRVNSSMIMHRASFYADWKSRGDEDWQLVKGWTEAGFPGARTGQATVTYRPSGGYDDVSFFYVVGEKDG